MPGSIFKRQLRAPVLSGRIYFQRGYVHTVTGTINFIFSNRKKKRGKKVVFSGVNIMPTVQGVELKFFNLINLKPGNFDCIRNCISPLTRRVGERVKKTIEASSAQYFSQNKRRNFVSILGRRYAWQKNTIGQSRLLFKGRIPVYPGESIEKSRR